MLRQSFLFRWSRIIGLAAVLLLVGLCGGAQAQEGVAESTAAAAAADNEMIVVLIWSIAFLASIVALVQAYFFFKAMMSADEGTERMKEIAGYVREGANAA